MVGTDYRLGWLEALVVLAAADKGVALATLKKSHAAIRSLSGSKHSLCEYNLAIESSSFLRPRWGWFPTNIAISDILLKTRFFGPNFCRSCQGWSTLKRKLSKSAFSEGVRKCERQFQVDRDVDRNRFMDRWIEEWCSYNFAAGSLHTKKLCSRVFSREVEFYGTNSDIALLCHPLKGHLGVTYTVHLWLVAKRVVDFLLVLIELFFASSYGWGAMSGYWSKFRFLTGGWVTLNANFRGNGGSSINDFWRQKTRVPGLSRGVVCAILCLAVLIQYWRVDTQTDTRWRLIPTHC